MSRDANSKLSARVFVLLVLIISIIPVAGVFTRTRVFFVRDLTMAFWPRFQFLRHSVASGTYPWWDPYPAHGQPAMADALYQLFHVPSLPIRLLLPEIPAFNVWVALPVPLAAMGMYLFLRRTVRPPAAAFGAITFALAGPIVSSLNFPNMSWSIAAVPFVFWALERLFERRSAGAVTLLAAMIACQALSGEPVSLATTGAIAFGYTVVPRPRRGDWRLALLAGTGMIAGLLLSAVQYVPLAAATSGSARSVSLDTEFWTFHPLALIELLVPHFFGDYFNSNLKELTWMVALNSGRDPFYYTMYIGVPVALLAAVAMMSARPATRFWSAVVVLCAVASLGNHTPVYPLIQAIVPVIQTFRFPVKYLSLASFALATLAALALQWILDETLPKRALRAVLIVSGVFAVATYVAVAWVLIAPTLPIRGFFTLAEWAKVPSPVQGAEFLLYRARPLFTSLMLKLTCVTFLLAIAASQRRERRFALGVLVSFTVIDLLASNTSVNPTVDARMLGLPNWAQQLPRDLHERVYIGGRVEGYVNTSDEDAPKYTRSLDEYSEMLQRYVIVGEYMFQTSGAGIRESMSYDLPVLWPIEFARAHSLFRISSSQARLRWLERVGTRYALLPKPPYPGATPMAQMVSTPQMHLYDLGPHVRRVMVVPDALIGPSIEWQIQGMFLERFHPSDGVLVSEPPPPVAGFPNAPVQASATFVEDGVNRVVVRAGLPADGYLALFDTYNTDWKVDVDGAPAPLMRANGIFRAVHVARGTHTVTFTYHPGALYKGAQISGVTALLLAVAWLWERRRAAKLLKLPIPNPQLPS